MYVEPGQIFPPDLIVGPGCDRASVESPCDQEEVMRQLGIGRLTLGKVWVRFWPLFVTGVAVSIGLAAWLATLIWAHRARSLVTVGGLGWFAMCSVLGLLVPTIMRFVRYRATLRDTGLRSLVAAAVAIAFKVHLFLFDPLFVWGGRLARLEIGRRRVGTDSDIGTKQ